MPEEHGGLAQGPIETALAMQAAGPALLVEPLLDAAVMATALLNALGDDAASADLLPAIASGERIVVVAHQEAAARGEVAFVERPFKRRAATSCSTATRRVVPGAGAAHEWLVSARESGDAAATPGVSVFRVARGTPGVHVRGCATIDGRRAAELTFADVKLPASARVGARGPRDAGDRARLRRQRWRRSAPRRWASCRPRSTRRSST